MTCLLCMNDQSLAVRQATRVEVGDAWTFDAPRRSQTDGQQVEKGGTRKRAPYYEHVPVFNLDCPPGTLFPYHLENRIR